MLNTILSQFQWYRRLKGGRWSYICAKRVPGMPCAWIDEKPFENDTVLKFEQYLFPATAETIGDLSDGYHTFSELYEHRHMLYLAMLRYQKDVEGLDYCPSWKARKHHDGGAYEGWFLVGTTIDGQQISYHLPNRLWDKAWWLKEYDRAPVEWDGHTSDDVLQRLSDWVSEVM